MRVRWTPDARRDRRDIYDYIANNNRSAAARLDKVFAAAATSLQTFPHRGRPGAIPATRELFPHENYRLVYVVASGTVTIIALVHYCSCPRRAKLAAVICLAASPAQCFLNA